MSFRITATINPDVHLVAWDHYRGISFVAEIVRRQGEWSLFHLDNQEVLTQKQRDQMNVFARNYIAVLKITKRLMG